MRNFNEIINNKKGMTLTNVMVAFVILLVGILMFQQVVTLSVATYTKAEKVRTGTENAYSDFYEQTRYTDGANEIIDLDGENATGGTISFVFDGSDSTDTFTLETSRHGFENDEEYKIYFFGNRKEN